ncbi:hypothetical protein [Nocardia aurea]|uniref:hypothetical protein n=1 Tax=Nocardia aurea TaxID=2144174 RepID=UPI0033B5732F
MTDSHPMQIEQFARWLANGERGLSSEAIVTQLTGVGFHYSRGWDHPHDAGDWRRCERLLRDVPEAREHLHLMKAHPTWEPLVDAWDELVELGRAAPNFFEPNRYWHIPALDSRIAELLAGVPA